MVRNRLRQNATFVKDQMGGIGLNNIRRRLNLLYPGKHKLDIRSEDDFFTVELIIMT
jgi:sensor histidine kinase YesM